MSHDDLDELYRRPGFMIRRAHQIATSVFIGATADMRVTTTQFGILYLLARRPDTDQITAARLLGLDRSTTGMVVRSLEVTGLVTRVVDPADKRRRTLQLTQAGRRMLRRLQAPAALAVEQLLAPLAPDERSVFLQLLGKLTGAFNATARVPLLDQSGSGDAEAATPARRAVSRREAGP
jgi:DNA-binding MarR family transcriptional regulator